MERLNGVVVNTKELRRAAFAIGFGLTFGKFAANVVGNALDTLATAVVKSLAKDGNKYAKAVCEKADISYEDSSERESNHVELGFHA